MVRAVAAYKADQKKLKKDRCGYRKICLDLESHHFQETGNYIYTILNDIQFIFFDRDSNQTQPCDLKTTC